MHPSFLAYSTLISATRWYTRTWPWQVHTGDRAGGVITGIAGNRRHPDDESCINVYVLWWVIWSVQ
jgi:hypothetical protein